MSNKSPNKAYKVKVGENILYWRRLKGMKQEELAKKIGISPAALSNIENGSSKPDIERIEDIAEALGLDVNQLLQHPQQFYAAGSGVQNEKNLPAQQHFDTSMFERLLLLMEKMTEFFSSKKNSH